MQQFDVLVIGQGYAGLKTAKLAAQAGLSTATIESMFPGGLIVSLNELDPVPDDGASSGPELAGILSEDGMDLGVENICATVENLIRDADGIWVVSADGEKYSARHVVIASGARLRKIGVPGETEYAGRGVSECADCDGPMYGGQEAVIIGGGDSAFQEAAALALYVEKVTILMRGAKPRARADLVDHALRNSKIVLRSNTATTAILGDDAGVTGVAIRTEAGDDIVPCAVVFIFGGLRPDTDYLPAEIARDESGAVITDHLQAGQARLWAVGAVRSGFGGLLTHASEDAEQVVAAIKAEA